MIAVLAPSLAEAVAAGELAGPPPDNHVILDHGHVLGHFYFASVHFCDISLMNRFKHGKYRQNLNRFKTF